jgi:hypothetical protein
VGLRGARRSIIFTLVFAQNFSVLLSIFQFLLRLSQFLLRLSQFLLRTAQFLLRTSQCMLGGPRWLNSLKTLNLTTRRTT